jgi:hypothetical protein
MKRIALLLILALALPTIISAQEHSEDERAQRMQKMTERVAKNLKIADETKQWFTQTYTAYLMALEEVQTMYPRAKTINENTTNEEYLLNIENNFKRSEATTTVKRTFLAVFSEKLTPAQLHELFIPTRQSRMNGRDGQGGFGGRMPRGGEGFQPMEGF